MNVKKEKEKWLKLQERKKKTCLNCSQLWYAENGNPMCSYQIGKGFFGGGVVHSPSWIKRVHELCFDKYNGKNI